MKLASLRNGTRDGRLVVVSRDLTRALDATYVAATMRAAIDDWAVAEPGLRALAATLEDGSADGAFAFDPSQALAPLPRSHQFVDASAFLNHGDIMERAYDLAIKKTPGMCILVPRQGDDFRGPRDDYEFPTAEDQCDFEGEFAVITDDVPMGATPKEALTHVKLVTILNDVSMRKHLFREISLGFGLVMAKPATIFAPVAVTPDELGEAWHDGRVLLDMQVHRNGEPFGHPNGRGMDWSFGELLAQLAYNRRLGAGMVLGSGTVSDRDYRNVGSACLAERRALEKLDSGESVTPFMQYGESLQFEVFGLDGQSVFGAIDTRLVPATPANA
ncbi:fumarylacetoacetate hydrolase family protein [Pseudoxanthomonas sp.]|uniref:fumarylacetoacetate hydrolase family protein n=1 Tax=Pseudoxanthomonas sp. TaxID=1871049 RepID=UPI0026182013|nr:fumarylacetoacetate hydrolase family protein [Pseudoxanthomonas sp.]WDS35050.1 MAG: fumarylacetoacetate hydrolase family protein [Pseudoxanthomonas sp.]